MLVSGVHKLFPMTYLPQCHRSTYHDVIVAIQSKKHFLSDGVRRRKQKLGSSKAKRKFVVQFGFIFFGTGN